MALIMMLASIAAFVLFVLLFEELKTTSNRVMMVLAGILLFTIPFIGNKPYEVENKTLITNIYEDIEFTQPMLVSYEIKSYPWWTWGWLEDDTHRNVVVSVYEPE